MPPKPLKTGTLVRIRKGTALTSTNPSKRKFVAGRTYTVKIHDSYSSWRIGDEWADAEVLWAGAHGYWTYVKLKDIEVLDPHAVISCTCGGLNV